MTTNLRKVSDAYCIDSLKIRIPLYALDSFDERLIQDEFRIINKHEEVVGKVLGTRTHKIKDDGLSLKVSKVRHAKGENVNCLLIAAPSKILGKQYFDGINSDTFSIIHDFITGSGLAKMSEDNLLANSFVTDFDIKRDTYFPQNIDFVKYCRHLSKSAIPTTKLGQGCKVFNNKKQGTGIQFATRRTATPDYPFLKLYDKLRHLKMVYDVFTNDNLSDYDIQNLVRSETTVKNSTHFQKVLGKDYTNQLGTLLNLSQDDLTKFINHAKRIHIEKTTAYQARDKEKLTGMELTIYRTMIQLLSLGMSFYDIEDMVLNGREKKDKQRTRKKINELYLRYQDQEKEAQNGLFEVCDLF